MQKGANEAPFAFRVLRPLFHGGFLARTARPQAVLLDNSSAPRRTFLIVVEEGGRPVPYLRFVVFAAAAVLLAAPALSQTPPGTPLFGTTAHTFARSPSTTDQAWCSADRGSSQFQRLGGGPARIALPEVSYSLPQTLPDTDFPVPVHYTLAGRAQLIFTSANSGKIYFDYVTTYPTTISQPNFTSYAQNYNSGNGVLSVVFRINFPDCSLLIAAVYRT